jgi:transcription elongation factor Elf1
MLKYDSKKKVRTVRLFPRAPKGSKLADATIAVGKIERTELKDIALEHDALVAENRRLVRELQKKYPREHECAACKGTGKIVFSDENGAKKGGARKILKVEESKESSECKLCKGHGRVSDYPDVFDPDYVARPLVRDFEANYARTVRAGVKQLAGYEVDDVDAKDFENPERIVELLDHAGHLVFAFLATLNHQSPEKAEVFSSGS